MSEPLLEVQDLSVSFGGITALDHVSVNVARGDAQTRPAIVRSVDEPARVPYSSAVTPTLLPPSNFAAP